MRSGAVANKLTANNKALIVFGLPYVLAIIASIYYYNKTNSKELSDPVPTSFSRIKVRDQLLGSGYEIVEVDGVEYLSRYQGGIYPLVKK